MIKEIDKQICKLIFISLFERNKQASTSIKTKIKYYNK